MELGNKVLQGYVDGELKDIAPSTSPQRFQLPYNDSGSNYAFAVIQNGLKFRAGVGILYDANLWVKATLT